jgi:uncharacterized membrane protein YeaQ/YmgE (transglycosylase-associated protein family)
VGKEKGMSTVFGIALQPGGIIAWIVVGLLAGWLAGLLSHSQGFGCFGNLVIGLIGAAVGGFIFSLFDVRGATGFWGSVAIATVGALILLVLARAAGRPGR